MKGSNWRTAAELLGIFALVVSLIFVGLELRQGRQIARAELYSALLGAEADVDDAINRNADIWLRGVAEEELTKEEELVFYNLVKGINQRMVTEYFNSQLLQDQAGADLVMRDFASFLYENPGARRVWLEREEDLNRYRELLGPGDNSWIFWQQQVVEALAVLDETANLD